MPSTNHDHTCTPSIRPKIDVSAAAVCLTSHDDDEDDDEDEDEDEDDVATGVRATRAHVVRRDANDDDAHDGAGCAERAGDGAA